MAMDLERQSDGRLHFSLGIVERWIAGVCGAAVVGVMWWLVSSMQTVLTQQAVTNQQLLTISAQLADVPGITRRMAEHDVRIERLEADVKEVRATRRLQ